MTREVLGGDDHERGQIQHIPGYTTEYLLVEVPWLASTRMVLAPVLCLMSW